MNLSKSELSQIRGKVVDEYKNLDLVQLTEKIKNNQPNLKIFTLDIQYEIINKNSKKENKFEKLIFFGKEDNIKYINKDYCVEFFLDVTFDIIPVKYRPYKLMVISGLPIAKKNLLLLCLF